MNPVYFKDIDGAISLAINETNQATITSVDSEGPVTVQLANDEEAKKMIAEFEDMDGELMNEEGSIFGKYKELHQFRP